MNKIFSIFILIFVGYFSFGQIKCGTDILWEINANNNKELLQKKLAIENAISTYIQKRSNSETVYNIPVVFHILYNQQDQQIPASQVYSQLQVLNDDFSRNNSDALNTPSEFSLIASDTKIQFCLAKRTPNNDTTNGITYTSTDVTSFSLYDNRIFYDSLGGKDIWNPSKYLNIYVCNLTNSLGFSSFPGGPSFNDGIAIDYKNFGTNGTVIPPYNLGRTATHEVGHWFNLFHIWGNGNCSSDMVDDTPVQETENYGCPIHPSPSCSNNGDMFQNFMDYTNDECMNLFTEGQKLRMQATLNTERSEVANNFACSLPFEDIAITENIFPFENQVVCGSEISLKTSVYNFSNTNVTKFNIYYKIDDQELQTIEWSGNISPENSQEIEIGNEFLNPGIHQLTVYTDLPNGFRDLNPFNDTLNINFEVKNGDQLNFSITSDNYGEEISWQITDEEDEIQFENNNILSNLQNNFQLCLDNDICYTLTIFDQENDGICCDFGNGFIEVNNQFFSGTYNNEIIIDLCQVISTNNNFVFDLNIYPNPTSGLLNFESNETINFISLYNIHGKLLKTFNPSAQKLNLNLDYLKQGIYLVQINTNKGNSIKKIILK